MALLGLFQFDSVDEFAAGVALVTSRIVEAAQIADARHEAVRQEPKHIFIW